MTPPKAPLSKEATLAAKTKIEVIMDSFIKKVEGHPTDTWWTHEVTGILENVRTEVIAALEANAKPDESLKALEAAVKSHLALVEQARMKGEWLDYWTGKVESYQWFLKLIAQAKEPKETRA